MNRDEIVLVIELPGDEARAAIAELRAKLDEVDAKAAALMTLTGVAAHVAREMKPTGD